MSSCRAIGWLPKSGLLIVGIANVAKAPGSSDPVARRVAEGLYGEFDRLLPRLRLGGKGAEAGVALGVILFRQILNCPGRVIEVIGKAA